MITCRIRDEIDRHRPEAFCDHACIRRDRPVPRPAPGPQAPRVRP